MDGLQLDLNELARPGRKGATVSATVVRELREEDLAMLAGNREIQPIDIKRISDRHHAAARMLSKGMKVGEVAVALGYTPSRLSILTKSPAFQELMALYRDMVEEEFAEIAGRMASITRDALVMLQDRMEETPEDFSNTMLMNLSTSFADRSGHGPTQKSVQVNIRAELGERLENARNRARAVALGEMKDVTPDE